MRVPSHPQHCFFRDLLHRARQVHLALRDLTFGRARRPAEQAFKFSAGHRQPRREVEILHVEAERAVFAQVNQLVENCLHVARLAVGREAHDLVLAGVDAEARVVCEGRVEHPQAVREV